MRNPFSRLAKLDTARPSLRERAASLKASASRVIRRKPVEPSLVSLLAVDPIFAAIDTTRGLTFARHRADRLPQPAGSIDVLPEQDEAADAFFAHVDGVLLKTVPTTAAGCTALARYAVQFREDQGFNLDEDKSNEQHVRILDLIARSPLLDGAAPAMPPAPDFSGYTVTDLYRTYNALKMATDIMGLTGWTTSPEGLGDRLLNAESDRLYSFQNYAADELARRDVTDRSDITFRADVLVSRAVACGNFDEVAAHAGEADAKRA